ncbi:hypothetical protein [Listeria valentina]|nr:hypothetical protein [Listeria valentina]
MKKHKIEQKIEKHTEKIILQQGDIKFELTDEMLSALFDLLMSMKGDK